MVATIVFMALLHVWTPATIAVKFLLKYAHVRLILIAKTVRLVIKALVFVFQIVLLANFVDLVVFAVIAMTSIHVPVERFVTIAIANVLQISHLPMNGESVQSVLPKTIADQECFAAQTAVIQEIAKLVIFIQQ